ncbi:MULTISPECIES: serine/threonine-protein kinase [unclassified Streptomyces]|uniref:serine/threonine-protein kinase n=1 Tax=unclassified Streptomyces TaxID=2593676 RepID=UPI00336AB46D
MTPNIVTVHDFGSAMYGGRLHAYLVMQLLPGKSLSTVLEAGRHPLSKAMYTAACVADALEAAHEAGLTHRDIKPSSIIVRSSGEATVVDFGITRGSDARHDITTTGVLIGTPAYMAPEALSGTFDCRSDMYSLGCVLYEMVTGQRPFTGTSWRLVNQHLNEQPTALRTLRPDAPAELERLVSRLMAKDPAGFVHQNGQQMSTTSGGTQPGPGIERPGAEVLIGAEPRGLRNGPQLMPSARRSLPLAGGSASGASLWCSSSATEIRTCDLAVMDFLT